MSQQKILPVETDKYERLTSWLGLHDLSFNPFQFLDASNDPYLKRYVITPSDVFESVRSDTSVVIFAPFGGGKTALRVIATTDPWTFPEHYHAFPVPYIFPDHFNGGIPPSALDHAHALSKSIAHALILVLLQQPHLYFQLADMDQQQICDLLVHAFDVPHRLLRYLHIVQDERSASSIIPLLERTYRISTNTGLDQLLSIVDSLIRRIHISKPVYKVPDLVLDEWFFILLNILGFRTVTILADGVDAFPSTSTDGLTARKWLSWLLQRAVPWSSSRVFVKIFAPDDYFGALTAHLDNTFQTAKLMWTPELLKQLIQLRIGVATQGKFDKLDALADPSFADTDIEAEIIRCVAPRPREVIRAVESVLLKCISRNADLLNISDLYELRRTGLALAI